MKTKILVTGADGFIGSHLVEELVNDGYAVKAFVLYNSFSNWGWLDTLSKDTLDKIEIFPGDVRDPNAVREAMKDVDASSGTYCYSLQLLCSGCICRHKYQGYS